MNNKNNIAVCLGVFLACMMMASQAVYAAAAGYTQFVYGNVQVIDAAGKISTLKKGAAVNEGDTLISAVSASAQIKMLDGGFIAVRPDTQLKLDSFVFNGKADGSEKSFFSLLKGGFRAVTGLIGQRDKNNYRITTANATIGIRGTDHETFVVVSGSPLAGTVPTGTYNKVNIGETFMTTDKGTIFVLANQMGFAGAKDQMPQLQPLNTDLFTVANRPVTQGKGGKKEGEGARGAAVDDPNQQGQPRVTNSLPAENILSLPICTTDQATGRCVDLGALPVSKSAGDGVIFTATSGLGGIDSVTAPHAAGAPPLLAETAPLPQGATYTIDAAGMTRLDCGAGCFGANYTAQILDAGWDGAVVHWGRWSNGVTSAGGWGNGLYFGPDQGWHYIVGIPTSQIPTNITATYNLIGGTSPTPSDGVGAGLGLGHLISGSATADFTNATINGKLLMGFNGASIYNTTYNGFLGNGILYGNTNFQGGAIDVCGVEGCMTQIQGQFYGSNASHLGVGYMINANTSPFNINGVAVYKR